MLQPATDVEQVVRRYYRIVSDLSSTEEDLRSVLAPDVVLVEHPNALVPTGVSRDLAQTVEGFARGKALLREQEFTVHEVIADGERAAARATWRGVIGASVGPFREGQELIAHVAAMLTVRDGAIVRHETFDCYEPFTPAAA
nr:nuclear transport factor 2 family protein [Microbacterium immunditiarum]